jgi:hypothetical protein
MKSLRLLFFLALVIVLLAIPSLALSRDDPEVDSKCYAKSKLRTSEPFEHADLELSASQLILYIILLNFLYDCSALLYHMYRTHKALLEEAQKVRCDSCVPSTASWCFCQV